MSLLRIFRAFTATGSPKVGSTEWNADLSYNGELPVANGGTGAANAADARTNLGIDTALAAKASLTGAAFTGAVSTTSTLSAGGTVSFSSTLLVGSDINSNTGYKGRAGVGGATSNVFNLYWTGSAMQLWVDSVNIGTISVTSDERVKKNIEPLVSSREAYLQIKPIRFRYREMGIFSDNGEQWGFSANNLRACVPVAVNGEPDAVQADGTPQPMSVNDRPILALTVIEVQNLIAELGRVKARLEALEGN